MKSVFVIGVDTGVGKTTVSAGILKLLHGTCKVRYWKPIQTGTIVGDDTATVIGVTQFEPDCYANPGYRFAEPVSPHVAARKWGKTIDLELLQKTFEQHVKDGYFVIVEGAGGLLAPLNDHELQIDLVKRLGIPVLLVSEDRVGAINQTLLTVKAAREAKIDVLGVILTRSRRTFGNAESIAHFGKVEVLAEIDPSEDIRNAIAQVGGDPKLRKLFGAGNLPH